MGNAQIAANQVAPMKVNSTKKVTNLNADLLDDREASSFADGVNGKATDAEQLDGQDSAAFSSSSTYTIVSGKFAGAANQVTESNQQCGPSDVLLNGGYRMVSGPSSVPASGFEVIADHANVVGIDNYHLE